MNVDQLARCGKTGPTTCAVQHRIRLAVRQYCPQSVESTGESRNRERVMDLGQLAILGICGVGTLGALVAMAFYAQKNSAR